MYYQQGDVLLFAIDSVPSEAKVVEIDEKIVLAQGEATGHAHVISDIDECEVYTLANELFVKVGNPVVVTHDEHDSIEVGIGVWRVAIVREYDHFAEEARAVAD